MLTIHMDELTDLVVVETKLKTLPYHGVALQQ